MRAPWHKKAKSGIYNIPLRHGTVCAMLGDMQTKAIHSVPAYPEAKGERFNLTFRVDKSVKISNGTLDLTPYTHVLDLGEDCLVGLFDCEIPPELYQEISLQMQQHEQPDSTRVFGKLHLNKGRAKLQLSYDGKRVYSYAQNNPGIGQPFGPLTRAFIETTIMPLFGVDSVESVWAHVVHYPTPDCQLGWHSDKEDGMHLQTIVSFTLLSDPVYGVRPFCVRLNSAKELNKKPNAKKQETQQHKRLLSGVAVYNNRAKKEQKLE